MRPVRQTPYDVTVDIDVDESQIVSYSSRISIALIHQYIADQRSRIKVQTVGGK